jgi:GSCFA family
MRLRRYIKDAMEVIHRRRPAPPAGLPKYGLEITQVYPQGQNLLPVLQHATTEKLRGIGMSPATPVCSIGTCFAEEFAYFMRDQGYNYVRTENDALAASANWGRVYTIPNLQQIVRYSTESSYPLVLEQSDRGWFDPLREPRVSYAPTRNEAEDRVHAHRSASRAAFVSCEILIITVGQNEAWVDHSNGQVWAAMPPRETLDARGADFSVTQFSFERNLTALREIVERLRSVNQNLRMLFTVSPVAAHASFSDLDVISQSFANKCLLRAVVNELVSNLPGVTFYFPSFEIVLCDNPRNFRADNRHVKYAAVERIFSMLSRATALN